MHGQPTTLDHDEFVLKQIKLQEKNGRWAYHMSGNGAAKFSHSVRNEIKDIINNVHLQKFSMK
jgi:hypothetical protein